MLRVNKKIEPDFLLEFKRKKTPETWYDYNHGNIKSKNKLLVYVTNSKVEVKMETFTFYKRRE